VYALNVFYAGERVNNWSEGLWPHSSSLASPFAGSASKKLYDYQITNMGSALTMRTFCHENGHMVCDFPDLYDYGYESVGVGNYCLMGYGGSDLNPTQISAYLKNVAGWTSRATTLEPAVTATVSSGRNDFLFHRKSATEYFIIENRQQDQRDAALPDAGLLIWHVDELGSNSNEQMTASEHYELSLEQADGRFDLERNADYGDGNDLFGSPGPVAFSATTSPNSNWWDGTPSGLSIVDVSAPAASMTVRTAGALRTNRLDVARNRDGRLELFFLRPDGTLMHNWQVRPNGDWAGEAALGGAAGQLDVGRNADGRLEVFYVGLDDKLYHDWQHEAGAGWHGSVALAGAGKQLRVASNADGRLEVFYVGTDSRLYHNWQTAPNGAWSGEAALGGTAKQLSVRGNADGRLEVFYIGTDDALYHNWQSAPNGSWSGQAPLGGAAKQLTVGSNADGRLEVFYIGTNDALYHNWQRVPNGSWVGQVALPGSGKQLVVDSNADGRLELFYVGSDDRLYHNWQKRPNDDWVGQVALGGSAQEIASASNQDGRLEVFYIGTNGVLYHNWQKRPNDDWVGQVAF
jgi:hypothetical protein